jgi:hypothetical protein
MNSLTASVIASVVVALTALSFPQYFLIVPFANGVNVLSLLGLATTVGIVALIVLPPLLLRQPNSWSIAKSMFFLFSVSLYTLSTLLIKLYTLATLGRIWADYLIIYPILFFIEWLLPTVYVIFGLRQIRFASLESKKAAGL